MGKRLTTEEFITKAREVHGDKYDYSKVEYKGHKMEVCIVCKKCGREFWQTPKNHLRSNGCPTCSKEYLGRKKRIHNNIEFIEESIKIHGNKYDYSKVNYVNSSTKVCIICPIHGEFWQLPTSHLSGKGCLACSGKKRLTKDDFVNRAIEVHGLKYDYSLVEYENLRKKVEIICPKHGSFWQSPAEHMRGFGCIACSIEERRYRHNKWNHLSVYEVAKKITTFKEFRELYPAAYTYARKNKMLDNFYWLKKERESWTMQSVIQESKKYTSRSEFNRNSSRAYYLALSNNLLDSMTWLVPKTNNYKDAHVIYSYIDETNKAIYIGQTLRPYDRDKEHRKSKKSTVNKYFSSIGVDIPKMNILETNLQDIESQIRENYWVEHYKNLGYKIINIAKTGYGSSSLGLARIKWTKSKIFKEASKYKSSGEFKKGSEPAYQIACRKKYIQEIADKFNWILRIKWNEETCLYYFLKCKSISDFKKKHSAGYKYAIKNKIQLIK